MRIAEITRTATSERGRLLQVQEYDVALDLTRGAEVFGSASVIRFRCAEPGAAAYADLAGASVREIVLNGEPVDPATAVKGEGESTPPTGGSTRTRTSSPPRHARRSPTSSSRT